MALSTDTRRPARGPILVAFFGVALADQLSKTWALSSVRGFPARSYAGDLFRIEYAENPGAFLGLGDVLSPTGRFWILTIAVGAMLALGFVVLGRMLWPAASAAGPSSGGGRGRGASGLALGLSIVLSGGLSNLGDRLFRTGGRVVDFLNLGIGGLRTGIFNVADVAIMAGVVLLFAYSGGGPKRGKGSD